MISFNKVLISIFTQSASGICSRPCDAKAVALIPAAPSGFSPPWIRSEVTSDTSNRCSAQLIPCSVRKNSLLIWLCNSQVIAGLQRLFSFLRSDGRAKQVKFPVIFPISRELRIVTFRIKTCLELVRDDGQAAGRRATNRNRIGGETRLGLTK